MVIKISAIRILARRSFVRLRRIPQFCIFNFDFCIPNRLTPSQIMTYEKQTSQFDTIQAIWLTIQLYFSTFQALFEIIQAPFETFQGTAQQKRFALIFLQS